MKRKTIYSSLLVMLLCIALLSGCATNAASAAASGSQAETTEQSASGIVAAQSAAADISSLVTYEEEDYYSDWENANPNYIQLTGSSAEINDSGAVVKAGNISITAAGVYVLSGKLDNGQIVVDVADKGTVRLVLNGAELKNNDNSAIYIKNAEKTVVTLQEGTENHVSDGAEYAFEDASSDEPNGAIFSKGSLVINGSGSLTVLGNYNNGIVSKDDLKITGGTIKIISEDDGIIGKDMVAVKEGSVSIEAVGDGIKATNDTDTSKGIVVLEGGSFDIVSGADGIQAETTLFVGGGSYKISTGGGSANGSAKTENKGKGPWENTVSTDTTEETSAKALKASDIFIKEGSYIIDSSDDALHSNNNITITGGDISITSGDDGIHGDAAIAITGGKIDIVKSYEGIESAVISVTAGDIHVVSSDDGINVAGGNDGSATNGRSGQNSFSTSNDTKLDISGGYIVVDASGDGLDANGSIYMSGGTVLVNGPTSDGNGALDYDGICEITGGLLVAAGSSGMAQAPSEGSTQYSVLMSYSQMQQGGTAVNLKDSEGKKLVDFAPGKDYQSVLISTPELKTGSTYTLYSGEIEVVEFTISDSVTWLSETGVTTGRAPNMGGPGRPASGGDNKVKPQQ